MLRKICSANAVLGRRTNSSTDAKGVAVQMQCWKDGPVATRMQRELQYKCSSGNDRAMGRSTGCSSAEDGGWGGLALAQGPMSDDQGDTQ